MEEITQKKSADTDMAKPPTPAPFPYCPPQPPIDELMRMEVMFDLNKWANNDPAIAKRSAETLILLVAKQFDIVLKELNQP